MLGFVAVGSGGAVVFFLPLPLPTRSFFNLMSVPWATFPSLQPSNRIWQPNTPENVHLLGIINTLAKQAKSSAICTSLKNKIL